MIEVNHLSKDFGSFRAVDQISFSVPKGQVLGFLGPNGAGKSTTMKMLTGFITPSSGTASIDGFDISKQSLEVRKRIGYLPESAPTYQEMTVCEFLQFIAEIRKLEKTGEALERMKAVCFLSDVWHQPIETLSKGYRQRVGFAQALIHDPPVLILDEPTDGLDPNQKYEVRQVLKQMGQDKTIILSTHILEEVEAICERVIIIANGKLVEDATPQELLKRGPLDEVFRRITLGDTPDASVHPSV
ncbi:MAG: ABC transporter ATP-binding protein [Oligoflexus sp.]